MLVDDDADIRAAFADVLSAEGYAIASAEHGRDALDQLSSSPLPDLILLDLMMPVMNGKDFLAAIATEPTLAEIPLVVCTAFAGLGKELNRAVLRKPIDLDELLETVRATCGIVGENALADADWGEDEEPTDRMTHPPVSMIEGNTDDERAPDSHDA